MEQKRLFLFFALSMAIVVGWTQVIVPVFFPELLQPPVKQQADAEPDKIPPGEVPPDAAAPDQVVADADQPAASAETSEKNASNGGGKKAPTKAGEAAVVAEGADANPSDTPPAPPEWLTFPEVAVDLGSLDPKTGYFQHVVLTSRGAAVHTIELNDPRYRDLTDPKQPLRVVETISPNVPINGEKSGLLATFATGFPAIDKVLKKKGQSLRDVGWEVVATESDADQPEINSAVEFRLKSPDRALEIRKRYSLAKVPADAATSREVRDTTVEPYELKLDLTITNLTDQKQEEIVYHLQGPVGVPLENVDNTRKFRDIRMGFISDDGSIDNESMTANDVDEGFEVGKLDEWKSPFRYLGVDVQYFAALVIPELPAGMPHPIAVARPMLTAQGPTKTHDDISVDFESIPITLEAGKALTQRFALYAGPKRQVLLEPIGAAAVIDFGFFSPVSRAMLWLLTTLHNQLAIPYAIAIVILTVLVRGSMYPVSLKQAAGAKKMKELQPKIAELRKKYANDKEKMARAQMELFSKHNYNPFAGCLPIFLQLPIFIGLYQALNNAVDLRMARFLWIDNLAAPDALFALPFVVPFVGWTEFNLLPFVTVGLFILQQKMFMPPATDPEQEMQQKMMNFMMLFMGFLFYRVPAGLCIYFIASSLWGIGERKILDWRKEPEAQPADAGDGDSGQKKTKAQGSVQPAGKPKREGIWSKLAAAADAAAEASRLHGQANGQESGKTKPGQAKKPPRG